MTLRQRMSEWLRPTITYPMLGEPEARVPRGGDSESEPDTMKSRTQLAADDPRESARVGTSGSPSADLRDFRAADRKVIVTRRGTCIPIHDCTDWRVIEVANYLAWVDSLLETSPGSRRA